MLWSIVQGRHYLIDLSDLVGVDGRVSALVNLPDVLCVVSQDCLISVEELVL